MRFDKTVHHGKGVRCSFHRVGKKAGFKVYRSAWEAKEAYQAQRKMALLGLAPKAYAVIGKGVLVERVEAVFFKIQGDTYGFGAAIVADSAAWWLSSRMMCKPQIERLDEKLHAAGMNTDDLHAGNVGYLRRLKRWVGIDFDPEFSPVKN